MIEYKEEINIGFYTEIREDSKEFKIYTVSWSTSRRGLLSNLWFKEM